jgi:hypothetical protein
MNINKWLNGIIAHPNNESTIVMKGAIKNKKVFDLLGIVASFKINFIASAIGCSNPKPTTLGPLRRCIVPITLRSANVKKATVSKIGIMKIKKAINHFKIII